MWRVSVSLFLVMLTGAGFTTREDFNNTDFDWQRIEKISLIDEANQSRKLNQHPPKPLTIFVFLSPECPLCKNYTTVLNKIVKDFPVDSVSVVGLVSGKAYSAADVSKFKKDFSVSFQLLIDPDKKLTDYLKATITPEVVVLNDKGTLVYRGAIDDWVTELGKNKLQPEKEYLRLALNQYIRHQPITIKKTRPKGCYINEY